MARYSSTGVFQISHETYNEIDDWIRAAEHVGRNAQYGMNALASLMARTNQAIAMEMSHGVLDPAARYQRGRVKQFTGYRFVAGPQGVRKEPQYKRDDEAWKIPVRRITQNYYRGWKVRRAAPGIWMLYNDSREAWFIEFGIHPGSTRSTQGGTLFSARVRRPIRKLSLMKTLRFIDQSKASQRVWEMTFAPFRQGRKYTGPGSMIVSSEVQSVEAMRNI